MYPGQYSLLRASSKIEELRSKEVGATIDYSHILRSNTVASLTSITEAEAQRCPSKVELSSNTVFKIPTVAEVNQPTIVNVKQKQWRRSRYLSCVEDLQALSSS